MKKDKIFSKYLHYCPVCGNYVVKPWFTKDYAGLQFKVDKCCACGSGYINPQPPEEYLQSLYSCIGHGSKSFTSLKDVIASEAEFPNSTVDAKRMVTYAKKVLGTKKEDYWKALDIGSGYGLFSRAALDQGFKVVAVNPAITENSIFKELNGFDPIPLFFEEIDFGDEKFDLVILSQVLEHILDPLEVLIKVRNLLEPGGVVAIAVPNVDAILIKILKSKSTFLGLPEHLFHFSRRGLGAILQRAGLNMIHHVYYSRIPYFTLSNKFNLHGISRKSMNLFVKVLQWPPLLLANLFGYGLYQNVWAIRIQ